MPIFHYQAFDATGALHKGTQDAANESEVRQLLRSKDLFPKEIRTSRFTRKSNKAKTSEGFKLPEFAKRRNYAKSLMLFTRQLEVLLDATIPYDKAFQLIIPQTEDHSFQSILSEIRGRLLEGESLANSMEKHPEAFPAMYISMVRSGENGGNLGMIMKRLADYYERQDRLRSQIRSAMIYPAFMTVFGFAVVVFMVTNIVPKITRIFESRDAALPLPTRLLIGLSELLSGNLLVLAVVVLLMILSGTIFLRSPSGRRFRDWTELKLPMFNRIWIKILVARYCQTLGTLLKSGVDLKTSLEIAKHVVVNRRFISALDKMIIDVNNKGVPLSAAMGKLEYFPEYVRHVVAIGEEAARVDELLEKVADRMQEEIQSLVEALTALLQPALILLMGGIVGFIALAVLLPMLSMNQLLQ
ncbi:MAG: type II secretion system F family protein [bacterium]|jgi:type II secretory pathway component PulF|tara:strand:+ start:876 stop:2117 length:1242 start_codon:yes stop_codon:yes gene_type:complete